MNTSVPYLSIVIPAYNEERRIVPALESIIAWRDRQTYDVEVIVVENGSSDRTADVVSEIAETSPGVRLLVQEEAGKGAAVRRGMLEAAGTYRYMCDADLATPATEIHKFLPPEVSADVAIGSREAAGAQVDCPWRRKLTGRIFNTFVRVFAVPGIRDTQCGFKCFTAAAATDLFERSRCRGWAFDVELLMLAKRRGYKIVETPVAWTHDDDSRVRVVRDGLRMLLDMMWIRSRLMFAR